MDLAFNRLKKIKQELLIKREFKCFRLKKEKKNAFFVKCMTDIGKGIFFNGFSLFYNNPSYYLINEHLNTSLQLKIVYRRLFVSRQIVDDFEYLKMRLLWLLSI